MSDASPSADRSIHRSIREAARRLLRAEITTLKMSLDLSRNARAMILELSDLQPARTSEPTVEVRIESNCACLFEGTTKSVQLSGSEPAIDICWVPGQLDIIWPEFERYVRALAVAGYPGCVGCGGSDAESRWDEAARRSEMLGN